MKIPYTIILPSGVPVASKEPMPMKLSFCNKKSCIHSKDAYNGPPCEGCKEAFSQYESDLTAWEKQCMEFESEREFKLKVWEIKSFPGATGADAFVQWCEKQLKLGTVIEGLDLPCVEVEQFKAIPEGRWYDKAKGYAPAFGGVSEYRTILRFVDKAIKETEPEFPTYEEARAYLIAEGLDPDEIAREGVHFVHGLIKKTRSKLKKAGEIKTEPCDRCDGVGWYEGAPKLQNTCEDCNGTGVKQNHL